MDKAFDSVPLNDCIRQGLAMLLRAHRYAQSVGRPVWDFAVEIERLRELGMGDCDFRLLAILKYTEHAQEITPLEADGREFRPVGNLSFPKRSCFVLTTAGINRAAEEEHEPLFLPCSQEAPARQIDVPQQPSPSVPAVLPSWNTELKKLTLEGKLVKHFKWPAVNQERILAAFEEDGWPARIDDPLPPQPQIDPKRRLHDTIKNLNKNQHHRLISFRGDGTGEGVIWELFQKSQPAR